MKTLRELVREHRDEILRRWVEGARRAASAQGLERPELSNLLPSFLDEMARAGDDLGDFSGKRLALLESHTATRIRGGFLIAEMVDELLLLGRCVEEVSEAAAAGERLRPRDREALWAELHRAAAAVTAVVSRHMAEDEQTEKRFLRLLQSWASRTLKSGVRTLDGEPLREALRIVMQATGTKSAALLLYESSTGRLVTRATAGAEQLESFVATLDASSFAGQVASAEESASLEDVATTELKVPDSLRTSGIHSLLGVRLPPQLTLFGVLYVGVTENRPFSAREVRRLEALGDRLTILLENARLFEDLTDKIEALGVERDARETFTSILAHDLRGPLQVAQVGARLLMEDPDRKDRGELAAKVERNLKRIDRMIHDLLDASQLRSGEPLSLQLGPCDLAAITRDVAAELRALHGDRFRVGGQDRVEGIWSADDLRRALWNLGTNAAKYGAPGGPVTFVVEKTPRGASVSIHNVGAPILPEDVANLFRPFGRARTAQAAGSSGWGLGLVLVRGCAEAHGGRVEVESDAASGTTFTLELPLDARPYQRAVEASLATH